MSFPPSLLPPSPSTSHNSSHASRSRASHFSFHEGGEREGAKGSSQGFLSTEVELSTSRVFNDIRRGGKNAMFHTAAPVCRHPFLRGWKSSFSRPVDERTSPEIVYTEQIRGGSRSSSPGNWILLNEFFFFLSFFFFINFTWHRFKFVAIDVKFLASSIHLRLFARNGWILSRG